MTRARITVELNPGAPLLQELARLSQEANRAVRERGVDRPGRITKSTVLRAALEDASVVQAIEAALQGYAEEVVAREATRLDREVEEELRKVDQMREHARKLREPEGGGP